MIGLIENFEAKEKAGVEQALAEFSAKYGSSAEQIEAKAKSMGYSGNYRASYAYTELTKGLENIAKTRTVMADDLVRRAGEMKGRIKKGMHDFFRVKHYTMLKEWAASADRLDKDNPRVKDFQAGLDSWIKQDMADLNGKIDKGDLAETGLRRPGRRGQVGRRGDGLYAEGVGQGSGQGQDAEEDYRDRHHRPLGRV